MNTCKSIGKMEIHEESQDVDITILPDNEQPLNAVEGGDTLPHFQFFEGGGALKKSTDGPVEGFVALKITYEHVFKKQREQMRLLQQKNQQLVTEIQELKEDRIGSVSDVKVERNPCVCEVTSSNSEDKRHLPVEMQPINMYPSVNMKDHSFQLATFEADKAKLRSGLMTLANCLLKRESENKIFCNLLRKILENLQGSQFDSDASMRELCSLLQKMSDLDDLVCEKNGQGPTCSFMDTSYTSLQKLESNYQQMDLQRRTERECESLEGSDIQDQLPKMKTAKSQDEDMYGPEGTLGNNFVPYDVTRLHTKLKKLQLFPAKYESMVQHMNASYLAKQRPSTCRCNSWNGNLMSPPRNLATDLQAVPSSSGLLPEEMTSFVEIQKIKLPPTDLPKEAVSHMGNFTGQTPACPESPVTTHHQEKMTEASRQSLDARCTSPMKPVTNPSYESEIRRMSAYQPGQVAIARKASDQDVHIRDANTKQIKSGASENLTFERACQPPGEPNVIALGANEVSDWHSSKHCTPFVISTNDKKQAHGKHVHSSGVESGIERKQCAANFLIKDLESKNVIAAHLAKTDTTDPISSEWTLVAECPQGPYIPGSESVHDQLVTAHSSMHNVSVSITQIECPVCMEKFPQDTSEEMMTVHVNSHFDGTLLKNDTGFEILDN